ncbi:MAG TPA: hypothetical protein VLZ77_11585 [Acidimicrobiales bacterium]|nr:hypothetical protein [Acidimicrobiales bacterium]
MPTNNDSTWMGGDPARHAGLWRTASVATGTVWGSADSATAGSGPPGEARVLPVPALPDAPWQSRIDQVVSSGLSSDAARKARLTAEESRAQAAFEAFRLQCETELKPVLETTSAMLKEWGLDARVTETLHDRPTRLPRSFDLALRIDPFGERGPGKLTISASEAYDVVRVKISVGPSRLCGEVHEHVGTTTADELSEALVGGLAATLVEKVFSP